MNAAIAAGLVILAAAMSAGGDVAESVDDQPRRVQHIEYAASVHLGDAIELAVG